MNIPVLKAEPREERGKRPASTLRIQGRIPAVCYGREKKPLALSVDPQELTKILNGPRGMNSLIKLEGGEEERTVFVQTLQRDPVNRNLLHVDFLYIDTSQLIQRQVPIEFSGKPEGVKQGGVLQITRRKIDVEALPTNIPDKVSINVNPLLIGQSIHVEEVTLPDGVKALYERNYSICAVVAPTIEEEKPAEEEVAAEAAPGEEVSEGEKPAEAKKTEAEKPSADSPESKK